MSGSVLVSTFVGLLINQAKVRGRGAFTPKSIQKADCLMFVCRVVLLAGLWTDSVNGCDKLQ